MNEDFSVPEDWYASFFTEPFNRFWEQMVPADTTAAEISFILSRLALPAGGAVLDAPCGAGRLSLPLARLGYRLTGVDLSEDAIARGAATARSQALPIDFRRADMRNLPAGPLFDGALCMGNSFSYLSAEQTAVFVRRLADRLKPGARLIVDTATTAESLFPTLATSRAVDLPNGRYEAENRYSPREGVLRTKVRLTVDGQTHEGRYLHRVFTVAEWVRELETGGFRCLELCADPTGAPFMVGAPRLYGVFER